MREQLEPNIAKWPFYAGDVLLLGAAYFIFWQSKPPMDVWQIGFVVLCVAGGAWLGVMPFLLEYRLLAKLAEARGLTTVVGQLQNLEALAAQITGATGRWQNAQEEAEKVATAAKSIAERMGAEVHAFTDFMQRINDTEKANLRLEVEKLRRGETEWLQVLVRTLDHVYALHLGALRSGQPNLVEQMGNFQNACRDAARRVGLTPFAASPAEAFDAQRHEMFDGSGTPPAGAVISETIATGYTFQGRLLRPALVRLSLNGEVSAPEAQPKQVEEPQSELALGAAGVNPA